MAERKNVLPEDQKECIKRNERVRSLDRLIARATKCPDTGFLQRPSYPLQDILRRIERYILESTILAE